MNSNLPHDWRTITIGEIRDEFGGSIQTGPFGSQLHASDYQDSGIPVVMPQNLGQNKISQEGIARIGNDDWKRLSQHHLKEGDIIFPRRGDISRYAYVTKEYQGWLCGTGCIKIRLNKEHVETKYLAYYWGLPSTQAWLFGNAVGTTMLNLNSSIVRSVPIVLPPLPEQKRIAEILGALDDKIELNRRMNRTLEDMARALFQSWFVDFDPVHAKARGETPYGMDDATAALFPDSFEETALGLVPTGWIEVEVKEISNINASTLSKKDVLDFIDYIEISEVTRGQIGSIKQYIRGEEPSRARRRLRHGDTVISTVRPDRAAYFLAMHPTESLIASTGFAVLTPQRVPYSFLHLVLSREIIFAHLGRVADGGAYPAINPSVIGDITLTMPSNLEILSAFHLLCEPIFEQINSNSNESRTLADLRDTVLPKLVSGEVQVLEKVYEIAYTRPTKMVAERLSGNTYKIKSYWNNQKDTTDDRSPSSIIRGQSKRLRTESKDANGLERNPRLQRALSSRGSGVRRTRRA